VSTSSEWQALRRELQILANTTSAFNAYVVDAWGVAWCAARYFESIYPEDLATLVHLAEERRRVRVTYGGKLDTALSGPRGHAYVRTYASCYVVLLRYAGPFDETKAREATTAALPRLEALTLRLPPPDGPGSSGNQAAGSA
jgi:hypothetical protein